MNMRNHRMFCGLRKGRFVEVETWYTRSSYFGTTWSSPPRSCWLHLAQVKLTIIRLFNSIATRGLKGLSGVPYSCTFLFLSSANLSISWSKGMLRLWIPDRWMDPGRSKRAASDGGRPSVWGPGQHGRPCYQLWRGRLLRHHQRVFCYVRLFNQEKTGQHSPREAAQGKPEFVQVEVRHACEQTLKDEFSRYDGIICKDHENACYNVSYVDIPEHQATYADVCFCEGDR